MVLNYEIECPRCKAIIHVPFVRGLEAKAIEDYDMAEVDAQTQLAWFKRASLWQLFKSFWMRRA